MATTAIIGWVITAIVVFLLAKSGLDKVRGTQEAVGNFAYMKLEKYRKPVGIAEMIGAALLVTPGLSEYGVLVIASLMTAATALHLSLMGGKKAWFPVLIGIGAVLAHLLK